MTEKENKKIRMLQTTYGVSVPKSIDEDIKRICKKEDLSMENNHIESFFYFSYGLFKELEQENKHD